jgi:hypothetical protein
VTKRAAVAREDVKKATEVPKASNFPQGTKNSSRCQHWTAVHKYYHSLLDYDAHLPSAEFLRHPLRPLGRGSANKQRGIFNTKTNNAVLTFNNTKFSVKYTEIQRMFAE